MNHSLKVHHRDSKLSKKEIREKLEKGMISGVVYGSHITSTPIFIDPKGTDMRGMHIGSKFDLTWKGQTLLATCKEIQTDVINRTPKHVSFHVVERGETSTFKIPIVLKGESDGEKKGGVVVLMKKNVELKGPAQDIPEELVINISTLKINDKLMPTELQLPESVTIHEQDEFFDQPLVVCQPKQKSDEPEDEIVEKETELKEAV